MIKNPEQDRARLQYTKSYAVSKGSLQELRFVELTKELAEGLEFAGRALQYYPLVWRGIKSDGTVIEEARPADPEVVKGYLHFLAYKNLSSSGYSIDDIAGFVMLTESEIETIIDGDPCLANSLENGGFEVFGADYYFKPGKKRVVH